MFGYPGDGINGLIVAFGEADDRPRFIQSRHEEMSALEAVGYAKFSGRPGVCLATSGPGAIHLLNGLYDAKLDHVPVVAIVGQTERSAMGGAYQQEVDLQALFKDVASEYLVEVNVSQQLPNALDRAFRTALTRRAPTAVIIPSDLQSEEYAAPEHAFKQVPSSPPGASPRRLQPDATAVAQAAEILNAGERVAILIGQGARGAADEVAQVADVSGAGVAKALLGKDVLPDDLPFVTGSIGLLGHPAQLRADARLRHAADRRLQLPVQPVPARVRQGEGGADRRRRHADRDALPDRAQHRRRRRGHAARAVAAPDAAHGPVVAGDGGEERRATGGPRSSGRPWSTPTR